jgi:hypothetical protein
VRVRSRCGVAAVDGRRTLEIARRCGVEGYYFRVRTGPRPHLERELSPATAFLQNDDETTLQELTASGVREGLVIQG